MKNNNEIRWRLLWNMWLPLLLFLAPLILEHQLVGTIFTPYIYGILVVVVGIVYYFRMGLWQPMAVMDGTAIAIWTYFLASRPGRTYESFKMAGLDLGPEFVPWLEANWSLLAWMGILVINGVVFYTLGFTFVKALELEKSAIRLFRLAARELSDIGNGFTDRPYQAGEHTFSRNELIGLASFMERKKICVTDMSGGNIKFIFSMGISPLNKRQQDKLSYVAFADNGSMSVFISKHDYKQYRNQYTFNQLCEMMGKTFIRFAELYKNRSESMIITELRSV